MYADRVLSGSKGSIKDRLNGNSVVDFGRSRQITGKRQRQTDDKWKHDLYEDDEEPQVSRPKVGASDLRLKLQRKESQQMHPSGKGFHVGVQDLREKLSGTMHSQPPNTDLHNAKAVAAAAKSLKKSTPSPEASIPDTKKVSSSAPRKKQKADSSVDGLLQSLGLEKYLITFRAEEVDMTALLHMNDEDLKALGIPMGPRKKILLALESQA
ncbi:ankyrin repeat and SAM domain-containing protein 6-like protein [Cinnamomum micranthum f. kanehirae]|uniref:Ankyrin repeat and SAM domain-containing protein 6-like protein n=1 Tax=Cinnamomum micranthum f. kanehirae TaxID=337451 RepID=A0A3S3N880_9MAGN|nr:ankyrin repeat and SAM domain-containing protein 6-like protein [Cinnamomum micranthum f. kanehirae]